MKLSLSKLPAVVGWMTLIVMVTGLTGCTRTDAPPMAPAPRAVSATPAAGPTAESEPVGQAVEQSAEVAAGASTTSHNSTPAVTDVTSETATPKPVKKARDPIYNEKADARADIQAAIERAAYDNKRVLVKFGGNWCGWCWKLNDLFHQDREIASLLRGEYEVVLVDINSNREILNEYDPKGIHGYPWLTVLDASGKVLCNQDTGSLEDGPKHDPPKVKAFLEKWQTDRVVAEQALAAALERARAENKRVLVHIGAPWCGWCHVLDRFLREQYELVAVDYIDLKIDQDRLAGGKTLAQRLRAGKDQGGIPWMAILDADGETLVTSDGPRGNIGYPSEPHEIEHFIAMLSQTRQNLSDDQLGAIERVLQDAVARRKAAAH